MLLLFLGAKKQGQGMFEHVLRLVPGKVCVLVHEIFFNTQNMHGIVGYAHALEPARNTRVPRAFTGPGRHH